MLIKYSKNFENKIADLFQTTSNRSFRVALLVLASFSLLLLAAIFYLGASHQRLAAWDTSYILEAGWRLANGQIPHLDFYSPVFIAPFLLLSFSIKIFGAKAAALPLSHALIFPFFIVIAFWLSKRRLSALNALLFSLLLGVSLMATRYPGAAWNQPSYAMFYNRLAWALFALYSLLLILKPRYRLSLKANIVEAIIAGLLLSSLIFSKINYGAMALLFFFFTLYWRRKERAYLGAFIGSTALASLSFCYALNFNLKSLLADMQLLVAVQQFSDRLQNIFDLLTINFWPLFFLGVILLLFWRELGFFGRLTTEGKKTLAMAILLIFAAILICSANQQLRDIILLPVSALIINEIFYREQEAGSNNRASFLSCSLIASFLLLPILMGDLGSIAYSTAWKTVKADKVEHLADINTPSMKGLILPLGAKDYYSAKNNPPAAILLKLGKRAKLTSYQYGLWVNSGLAILKDQLTDKSRILVLDTVNPFPFSLQLPSPRGGALFWHYLRSVNDQFHPTANSVFATTDLLLIPKRPIEITTADFLKRVYTSYLQENFQLIAEDSLWYLYGKKSSR